jgi:hypothetical protein
MGSPKTGTATTGTPSSQDTFMQLMGGGRKKGIGPGDEGALLSMATGGRMGGSNMKGSGRTQTTQTAVPPPTPVYENIGTGPKPWALK